MRIQRISKLRSETFAQIDCKNVLSDFIFLNLPVKMSYTVHVVIIQVHRLLMGWW